MMPGPRLLRGSGMSQRLSLPQVPYVYRGSQPFDPEAAHQAEDGGPYRPSRVIAVRQEQMRERTARFAELRAQGVSVIDAGTEVGVTYSRARVYERMRKQALAEAEGAGT